MKKNISIVFIHYNTSKELEKSLLRLYSDAHNIEIIVVDNNSKEIVKALKKRFPNVLWIENDKNRGFSFAANQGAQIATGRWILFLNPDVQMSVSEVNDLYHFAERERLDAVSPSFPNEGYQKPIPSFQSLVNEFTPFNKVFSSIFSQKTLVGGCVLIKKKVLLSLGGWDERFFLWFEDSDLTQRLLEQKCPIGFAPFSVTHKGGASVNQLTSQLRKDVFFHSLEIYLKKHFSKFQQQILTQLIVKRFTNLKLYPDFNSETSWVVPNMDTDLLHDFLSTNLHFFNKNLDEVIIVSSKLTSKNIWQFRKKFPSVRFISIAQNHGFSSTVNIGFRAATTQWIGTVNDDVILNSDTIKNLKKYCKNDFGSLNPVVYTLQQTIESAGVNVFSKGKAEPIIHAPRLLTTIVPATNAACVLYNINALNKTGLFDEKFGSYLEDIDLSLRIRKFDYQNVVIKNATIIHSRHQTSKKLGRYKQFLDMKNWWLVIFKNWTFSQLMIHFPFIIIERLRNVSGFLKQPGAHPINSKNN